MIDLRAKHDKLKELYAQSRANKDPVKEDLAIDEKVANVNIDI